MRDGVGGAAHGKERPGAGASPAPSAFRKKQLRKVLSRLDRELHFWTNESTLAIGWLKRGKRPPKVYEKDVRHIEKLDSKRKLVRLELKGRKP